MINKQDKKLNFLSHIILIALSALIILPFIILLSASFSGEKAIAHTGYSVLPKAITLDAYKYVFKNPKTIIDAYGVTIFVSTVYTVLSTFLMALLAYPLKKSTMKGRNAINF